VSSEPGVSREQVGLLPYRLRFSIAIPKKSNRPKKKDGRNAIYFSMCIYVFLYMYTRGYNVPLSNKIKFASQISPCVSITKFCLNPLSASQHVTNSACYKHTLRSTLYYLALLAQLSVTATGALLFPLS
jgi:hypothetical protein